MPLLLAAATAATSYPVLTALVQELWVFALAILGSIVTVVLYFRKENKEKSQEQAKKLAEEKAIEAAWKKGMEECVGQFMPQGDIRKEIAKVDHATGENKIAIGQVSAAAEKGINAVHEDVTNLKVQMATFVSVPSELNTTKLEVKLLASEFKNVVSTMHNMQQEMRATSEKQERVAKERDDRLTASIERLSDKMETQLEKNAETRGRVNK